MKPWGLKRELESKKTMRVLLIDVNCKSGSTGKIVYDLYNYVNANGGEAAVCYGRGKKIKEKNIYKFGLNWETYLHAFLTRLTGYTGCFSYFSTKRLICFIKKFKPDVVHIHELHAYFINIVQILEFLKKQNIKIIHTLHCTFSYTGKCGHHLDCEKWKQSCGKCPRLREYVSTLCFDHTKSMIVKKEKAFSGFKDMTIVCPSRWLADLARQSFLKQYPVEVVHNGVDTKVFYHRDISNLRERLKISEKTTVFLSLAPDLMSESKGGKWVLKLANSLVDEDIAFIMVGVEQINPNVPSNVIQFTRINDNNLLAELYSLADAFLLFSRRETFSFTCAESISCGTYVVGFKCGAPETIFKDCNNFFFEYGDLESVRQQLITIVKEGHNWCNRASVSCYDSILMCEKYMNLYSNSR